ncbi:MAG: ATP-binding cassette domain-containing protein [Roseiflexus sp.]|nr:ATP-binding cassette domain-containing protein [Roseiflexus sp.]MDW8147265.1 ATP-binding cassette domain-containing protein [Roseiflexaceae bacterium]
MNATDHIIHASGLVKIYKVAELEVVALQGLDLEVARGEFLALVGPSGSGKSTLLNAIGGLDRPSAGQLIVDGLDLTALTPAQLSAYRRERVGFIWQQTTRNLLPYLSARENIELLMTFAGRSGRERRAWANELLEAVGMAEKASTPVTQLSGGQQQRVAIACALANQPRILLGDEPTGELDWDTAQRVLALLRDLRTRYGLTIVLVTHDPRVAEQADRVIAIRDGRTSTETRRDDGKTSGDEVSAAAGRSGRARAAEELVVVDRAGRLQIPSDQRALAGIGRRARVELVDGGILIRPVEDDRIAIPTEEPTSDQHHHYLYEDDVSPVTSPAAPAAPLIEVRGVTRVFGAGIRAVHALRGVDLTIERSAFVALVGPSGSGKTTLLNIIGGLDRPTSGSVVIEGRRIDQMTPDELTRLRRQMGFIFQSFALLPTSSAFENVELALRLTRRAPRHQWDARVRRVLAAVGLTDWTNHRPYELSGGQQQRVALARALVTSPRIILADEPTGDLDSRTGRRVLTMLRTLCDQEGVTLIMASHDPAVLEFASSIYHMRDGVIIGCEQGVTAR